MDENYLKKALEIMNERFGHDTLIALATADDTIPYVRAVNSYYANSSFYVITHALSNKMKQMQKKSDCFNLWRMVYSSWYWQKPWASVCRTK